MPTPLVTHLTALQAELAPAAAQLEGEKHLAANDDPPRMVWIVRGVSSRGARAIGGNPRSLADDTWELEVHVWGRDLDHALALRQALVSAVRKVLCGANYLLGAAQVQDQAQHDRYGTLVVQGLTIVTPLPETGAETLEPVTMRTVRPKTVAIDPGTPVAGDRNLDAPDEP